MKAKFVNVNQLDPAGEAAWRALAVRAAEPNPLFEPDCVIPAARHQTFGDDIDVVFAEEDGRFYACFPVRGVHRWSGIPYPFIISKVRRMTYCGTPLVDPERGEEAMAAILAALGQRRTMWSDRILVLQELAAGGYADAVIGRAAGIMGRRVYRYESWERPYLFRRPEATYNSGHTKKDLSNLARLRRKLGAALGAEPQLVDRSSDRSAIEKIIQLEAAGYKATTGVAMSTVPGEPEYFREMCDRFRDADRLRVYTLEANDVVCAVVMLLRGDDGLFMIKVGYDEQYARSSPGVQLHLDLIRHFHEHLDAQWIDVCTYKDNHTLLRMYPDRARFVSVFMPLSGNPVDRLVVHAFLAMRPIHRWIIGVKRALRPRTPVGNGPREPRDQERPLPR